MTTGSLIDTGVVGHDLSLDLVSDGAYTGTVRYRSDIVGDDAAQRLADLFTRFVRDGLAEPDRPLWTLQTEPTPAVPPAPTGGPDLLHEAIAQWARRTPDAPALVWPAGTVDFAAFVAAANRLAHTLRTHGVGPEVPVLVAVDRSPELFVAMLAVLTAGGVYTPVDPAAPPAQLCTTVGQSGAKLALTRGPVPTLPSSVARLPVSLDEGDDPGPPDVAVRPDHAAYLLFTSGSTGVPKGVVVEHRNVVAYLRALHTLVAPGTSHATVQPPTFDSSMTSALGALAGGGALHVVDDDTARDPQALAAFLAVHPVDHYKITPSHLTALLAGGDLDGLRPRQAVLLGGEAAGPALIRRLLDAGWGVIVHYGPTETTIGVCAGRLDRPEAAPLGPPLPGARVYLLDRWGKPVPPGCRGEVYVGGPQVTRGYLGTPVSTASAYVPDHFHGGRMYRTGDLARQRPDGTLVFCGRADRQVKVRGFRMEPGSVEATLESHPAVRASAVVVRDDRLVAYVTPADVSAAELIEFVATTLPAHAVPAEVIPLAELPMTRHGKLDLAALPRPATRSAGGGQEPATPVEEALLACWRAAMPGREFGVTDGFFDVGGDSIRAIHVVAEARRRDLPLTLRQLFGLRTIRAIAATVSLAPPRKAPLGLAGPTVLRVPPDASVTARPGVTVDGAVVTVDPALVPDEALAEIVSARGPVPDASGALLPASTVDALAGAAHEAYATTTLDLVVAAALRALDTTEVAVPAGVVRVSGTDDDEDLIRAVKTALRSPAPDAAVPAVRFIPVPPSVAVTGLGHSDRVIVTVAGARVFGPSELAARVRDRLVELVDHCVAAQASYHAADFPDAGLDEDAMARLLSGLDVAP